MFHYKQDLPTWTTHISRIGDLGLDSVLRALGGVSTFSVVCCSGIEIILRMLGLSLFSKVWSTGETLSAWVEDLQG